MGKVQVRRIEKADYDYIVSVLDRWWGGPAGVRAHPIFFYELGNMGLVAEDGPTVVGFLVGFLAPHDPPYGYVHFVGIDPAHRRRGVGNQLYARFIERCRAAGAEKLKAIAASGDEGAVAFHQALGFTVTDVPDYAGPGRGRIVFEKDLT